MGKDNLNRPLLMFLHLLNNEAIYQDEWVTQFDISTRSAQRDFTDIQAAIQNTHVPFIVTNSNKKITLTHTEHIKSEHILILNKLLFASRAFNKKEIFEISQSLNKLTSPVVAKELQYTLTSEALAYQPISHAVDILSLIWQLNHWIFQNQAIKFNFKTSHKEMIEVHGLPINLIFDDAYFYVIIYGHQEHSAKTTSTITPYRIDWLSNLNPTKQKIIPPHALNQKIETNLRNANYLNNNSAFTKLEFDFWGNLENALDKFPGSKFTQKNNDGSIHISVPSVNRVSAKMWLLSQGKTARVTFPPSLRHEIKTELLAMLEQY